LHAYGKNSREYAVPVCGHGERFLVVALQRSHENPHPAPEPAGKPQAPEGAAAKGRFEIRDSLMALLTSGHVPRL
jgi:hypothetical protein